MSLVIDASVTLSWYFEDERTAESVAVLERVTRSGAFAPTIWRLEVANAFQSALKRQRINARFRTDAFAHLQSLSVASDLNSENDDRLDIVAIANRFGVTVYDATYLELARRLGLPLASLDKAMRRAGAAIGVPLLGL